MKREPMVFAVAGMIFGFVLGYMAAGLGDQPTSDPHPRPRAEASARPAPGGADAPAGDTAPAAGRDRPLGPADPDEVRTLENLAARDKQNVQVRIELGNLHMDHAQYDEAARWYREALTLKPADNDVRVDLGASLLNLGRAPDALAEFDQALKNDPGHKKALFNKGLALMQAGRPQEAVAIWDDLLKRYPGDPQLQGLKDQVERIRAGRNTGERPVVIALVVNLLRIVAVLLIARFVLRFVAAVVQGYQGAPRREPAATEMVRDRVCDTFVPRSRALMAIVDGREQHFCSPECRDRARRLITT